MGKLRKIKRGMKKKRTVSLLTGGAVVGVAAAVLANAPALDNAFTPQNYERFTSKKNADDNYDYVAGKGKKSDLADKNDKSDKGADGDTQALKVALNPDNTVTGQNSQNLGLADGSNGFGNQENPNGVQFVENGGTAGITLNPGNSGNLLNGQNSSQNGSQNGTQGTNNDSKNTNGNGSAAGDDKNNNNNGDVPAPPPDVEESWEDIQLKPKDPVETVYGKLVSLQAEFTKDTYFRGDTFQASDANVTATFQKSDGTTEKKTLSYGGTDGYQVSMSTAEPAETLVAVFSYQGVTARAKYSVARIYVSAGYGAYGSDIYVRSEFPGSVVKGMLAEEQYEQLRSLTTAPNTYIISGGYVNLTDLFHRLIAYQGNEELKKAFSDVQAGSVNTIQFVEESGGYLKTMVDGFRLVNAGSLVDDRSYTYYPLDEEKLSGGKTGNVCSHITDVPDGYQIRRVTEYDNDLSKYRGDQVMEGYTDEDQTVTVPMGVTKIDLKNASEGLKNATTLKIPQSVEEINFESIVKNMPNLERIEYTSGDVNAYNTYSVTDGLVCSRDGTTLYYVPSGMKEVTIPKTVTKLAKGCFAGLGEDCVVRFEGRKVPELEGETGYTGRIEVQESEDDVVWKAYMFAFGEACDNISFGDMSGRSDIYTYQKQDHVLTLTAEKSSLAAIPQDSAGEYQVPEGYTKIAGGTFAGCNRVTDIVLGGNVKLLQEGSLRLPDSVETVTLKGSSTSVDPYVFGRPEEGAGVPDIRIQVDAEYYDSYVKTWEKILDPVYGSGTTVKLLKQSDDSVICEDGARYCKVTENGRTGYRLIKVFESSKTFCKVKEGTVSIAKDAFSDCSKLEIVYLPESVRAIESGAFTSADHLETVACAGTDLLSGNRTKYGLIESAEVFCTGGSYQSFELRKKGVLYGTTSDGKLTILNVSTDYKGTVTVDENTSCFAERAFKGCAGITDVYLKEGSSLESIGAYCFEGCTGVEKADLTNCVGLQEIKEGAFKDCTSLTSLKFPETVTEIPASMCQGDISLVSADLSHITKIGDRAFYECRLLSSLDTMTDVVSIGNQAFYGCQKLTSVVLPESLKNIGEECFENCTGLENVEMNGTVTGISRYCFYGCRKLRTITFSEQQKKCLKVIGVQAFGDCLQLDKLDLSEMNELTQMGTEAFLNCGSLATVRMPESLKKIPDRCFAGCDALSILEVNGETVPELGKDIFGEVLPGYLHIWVKDGEQDNYVNEWKKEIDAVYGEGTMENVIGKIDRKKEIVRGILYEITDEGRVVKDASKDITGTYLLPEDTIRIDDDAFAGCTGLEEIGLPQNTTVSLGDRCFKGCTGLKEVGLFGNITDWGEETFMDCTSVEAIYLGYNGTNHIDRIGTRAFKNCTGLKKGAAVVLRASVGTLGEECFAGCTNLPSIGVAAEFQTGLTTIEDSAFEDCRSLSALLTSKYTNLTSIGKYAFRNCDSLKAPSIPVKVQQIGEGCFMDCDNITTVSFYGGLQEYPKNCFKNCTKLTRTGGTAAAFSGLKRIGEGAYAGCSSLVSASNWNLAKYTNLEEIGDGAFAGCTSLGDSVLSKTVTKIGDGAFDSCWSMNTLTLSGTAPVRIGAFRLETMADGFRLLVPDSQTENDAVYLRYFELLKKVMKEEDIYRMLDSLTDGAKDRHPLQISEKESSESKDESTGNGNSGSESTEDGTIKETADGTSEGENSGSGNNISAGENDSGTDVAEESGKSTDITADTQTITQEEPPLRR